MLKPRFATIQEGESSASRDVVDSRAGLDRLSIDARRLFDSLYPLVHSIAACRLRRERADHTLQPTALVNEAFLRLVLCVKPWSSEANFLAAASKVMRRVLIDHARARGAAKRGGGHGRIWDIEPAEEANIIDLLDLDDCLTKLHAADPRRARVAELKLFTGLREDEIANLLGVARSTVSSDWLVARAWLSRSMSEGGHEAE